LLLAGGGAFLVLYHVLYRATLRAGGLPFGIGIELAHAASSLIFSLAGAAVLVDLRIGAAGEPDDARSELMVASWWHYLPYLFVLSAYGLLLQRNFIPMTLSMLGLTLAFGGIVTLVLLRQLLSLRENRQLFQGLNEAHLQLQQQAADLERVNQAMQQEIGERRRAEDRLSYDTLHDGLTGLPNRALFLDRLEQAGRKQKRNPAFQYAVLFLDLDSFKVMNDSLGHPAGNQILIHMARTLLGCVRGTDTVARLGGDEFAILLEEVGHPEGVILTAKRLLDELSQPVQIDGARLFISASIGIVAGSEINGGPEDILRDADLAMYQAKSRGKGCYVLFRDTMRETAISRMALESDLRYALENHQFTLWYQPIIELPERLVGFEALVRWKHPGRGLIAPAEFIPLAEETGLILPLGRWILETACRQAVEWIEMFPGLARMKMSINISGLQLRQPDFVHSVVEVLQETRLSPERLALEVTESVCLDGLDQVAATLRDLQALGIEVQIDDFGTGYSSLSYLQRLPVYTIKIDRSFIKDLTDPGGAPDIVRAIFSMVNNLGIKAVAEGIENEGQLEALRRLNCRYVQGYLLARPMEPDCAERWIRQNM
jgi:diguanylate cyclase (GGDEF)-like protein